MRRAVCLLRDSLHYRRDAFCQGLAACGFAVAPALANPRPGDVLVVWNRYGGIAETARQYEQRGAAVVVAENGYLGKNWQGRNWYSLALGHHLGAGDWRPADGSRWQRIGCALEPWQPPGGAVLVLGQRGIGERGLASPQMWAQRAAGRIGRRARIREHPGTTPPAAGLLDDLRGCDACATWASGAALLALLAGWPVWYDMPQWIGAPAGLPLADFPLGGAALRDDGARLAMFERLAWAIWDLEEIRSGEALERLVGR